MNIKGQVEAMNINTSLEAKQAVKTGYTPTGYSIILRPILNFIKHYIFMAGFLKGFDGLVCCSIAAAHIFVREIKIMQAKGIDGFSRTKRPPVK